MGVLDFCGDGIKRNEWVPLLKALCMDRSLNSVAIRSKARSFTPKNASWPKPTAIPRPILAKLPVILNDHLFRNNNLTALELDGLDWTLNSFSILTQGLSASTSLRSLSLRRCPTGDRGCEIICDSLRDNPCITSVDFSACNITEKGAFYVSRLLQHQNLNRYNENWKQSLRYRTPRPEGMTGLRRVTLSHNKITDQGAQHIIQVLYDDRWMKAIDLQNCHLSEESGQNILKLLQLNDTISILDVRNNSMILTDTICTIMLQLNSRQSQFQWNSDDPTCLPRTASQTTIALTGLRKLTGIRKTTSNIFPFGKLAAREPRLCTSTPNMNRGNTRVFQKTASTSEMESTSQVEILQKHLEQLKQQLDEEVEKRKAAEAERDQAHSRLENHLHELSATRAAISGRVLVEKNFLQQVNSAVSGLNQFIALIGKAGLDQLLNLSTKPTHQESWNTSYSSDLKCYDDEPTTTEISESKTKTSTTLGVVNSPPNVGQGDCLSSGNVKDGSIYSKNISDREEDSATLQNSCTEEDSDKSGQSDSPEYSEQSDTSWTTMASRSSTQDFQ